MSPTEATPPDTITVRGSLDPPIQSEHHQAMSYNRLRADDTSRIKIDVAIGVLVALRGCAPDQAFAELVRVMQRTGIGIGSIAKALVDLAGGSSGTSAEYAEAFNAWGELLAQARRVPVNAQ